MWDNFARLTALLAKLHVWFNNSTIYLDFSEIAPSNNCPLAPLGYNQGAPLGGRFLLPRGAILAKPPTLCHWLADMFFSGRVCVLTCWFRGGNLPPPKVPPLLARLAGAVVSPLYTTKHVILIVEQISC